MDLQSRDLENFIELKTLCVKIDKDPKGSTEQIKELRDLLASLPQTLLKTVTPLILATLFHYIKPPENKLSFDENQMEIVVTTLTIIFERTTTEKLGLFYNIYAFLLNEIYDSNKKNLVKSVREEYKLCIIKCMVVLTDSLSWDILLKVYSKDNAPKLSQILYVALEIAKTERLRSLRIVALECIMSIARIKNEADLTDIELSNQIADVFMFFLPGLSSGLRRIALEDEKIGHAIIQMAVRAWGRIVNLLMKNYNPVDQKITIIELQAIVKQMCNEKENTCENRQSRRRNDTEIKDYIQNSKRSLEWYRESDEKLQHIITSMKKLLHHSHKNVRLELSDICILLLVNCSNTIPKSIGTVVEMLITLTGDEIYLISEKSTLALSNLSVQFSSDLLKSLLENLEENFYKTINSMPRIFNGIDEQEQLAALNLLNGYLKLFGKYKLAEILYSSSHVQHLLLALLHICELEKREVCLLEEYSIQEFDSTKDLHTPWKRFRYFNNELIKKKMEILCMSLSQPVVIDIVSDFLIDIFLNDLEHRKEATLILNEILSDNGTQKYHIIKTVIHMYIDPMNWDLPTVVSCDAYGNKPTLSQIQNNIIQICLQVESIGKMALALGTNFQEFLLRTLYLVLERAGSTQSLIKAAGIHAISNISIACGYKTITELVNKNSDYVSFFIMRKLKSSEYDENVLNVLSVVMKHSTIDVLPSISSIIDGVLMQSCDEHQHKAFLRVFNIFVKCVSRWLNIKIETPVLKSKAQKENELREFQISSLPSIEEDYSDDIMEKTPEEMYREDMQNKEQRVSDEDFESQYQEYKKRDPPLHVKLTVLILKRSLNFLPSKDRERKLVTLEILKSGLEIIKDWEDELLPIVHEIWSPLVDRFKEVNEPLMINLSFQLLVILARLSKSFIRSRTVKDILPSLLEVLRKSSKESFLKDKGAAYRYTQGYKLQVELLQNLAQVVCDLDFSDSEIKLIMGVALLYLSDKQPLPLQKSALNFFNTIQIYNVKLFKEKVLEMSEISQTNLEYEKNVQILVNHISILTNTENEKYFFHIIFIPALPHINIKKMQSIKIIFLFLIIIVLSIQYRNMKLNCTPEHLH